MHHREMDLIETVCITDIDSRVFHAIVVHCLSKIKDISFIEGSLISHFLNRENADKVKGICIEQNCKNRSVNVKIEINALTGISLPEKAEEIQEELMKEITRFTGFHVGCIHVVFKNLLFESNVDGSMCIDTPLKDDQDCAQNISS